VLSNPLRAALLAGTFSLIALIGGPLAAASAAVESSRIVSPASPAYALFDETQPAEHAFTVSGTTNVVGNIALRCYYGVGPKESWPVVEEVTPSGGAFSVEVDTDALYGGPCVLRAVPVSDFKAYPPGSPAEEAKDPFQGPVIVGSRLEVGADDEVDNYYDLEASSASAYLDIESAGACGLTGSGLYAPSSLVQSADLFGCDAAFFEEDDPAAGARTRSDLQVDGADAYTPTTAQYLAEDLATTIPGAPGLSISQAFEPSSGLVTIHEIDPLVRCSPEAAFPPTSVSCREFVSTGVQLERTWQTSSADQVASMTDNWSSTDGDAHTLSALYEQWWGIEDREGGAFELPGSGGFAAAATGEVASLPTGAGAIDYEEDAATPAGGDGEHPQGALVYDTAPSEPVSFHEGSAAGKATPGGTEFNMPYRATVPATGAYTLRMAFVQAYALSEVQTLTAAAEASFATPGSTPGVSAPPAGTVLGAAGPGGAVPDTVSQRGRTGAGHGEVTFTLACAGAAGTSCEVRSSLTTVERLRRGRPIALAAHRRRSRAKTRTRRISVGSSTLRIPAGQRITVAIALNATGKRLLARFGHLPVHLNVVLVGAGQPSTIIAQDLTVEPRHEAKKRHRRREARTAARRSGRRSARR
jgi:hypothetical protein